MTKMSCSSNYAHYIGEFAGIEGVDKFLLSSKINVACCIDPLDIHIVTTETMFTSQNKQGRTFVYCSKHKDFIDITAEEKHE